MQAVTRQKIQNAIEINKRAIKSRNAKLALAMDLNLRSKKLLQDKSKITQHLSILGAYCDELLPFAKKIKKNVNNITEATHVCVIYLLFCSIFDNLNSFFILSQNGKHLAAGTILRQVKEGISMVELFSIEAYLGKRNKLTKWLEGGILGQNECREMMEIYENIYSSNDSIDSKKLSAHIYQMESQSAHNSYESILESISPFTEDFDFEEHTRFHRTVSWLNYAKGSLNALTIALKRVYLLILNQQEEFKKLDCILMKYSPEINERIASSEIGGFEKIK